MIRSRSARGATDHVFCAATGLSGDLSLVELEVVIDEPPLHLPRAGVSKVLHQQEIAIVGEEHEIALMAAGTGLFWGRLYVSPIFVQQADALPHHRLPLALR